MRNLNHFPKFWLKNGAYSSIFFLSILALFLSITTLSTFYPHNPISFTNKSEDQTKLLDTITEKLMDQIKSLDTTSTMNSDASIKNQAFLAEILGLIQSLKSSVAHQKEEVYHRKDINITTEFFLTEEIRKYARSKPNRHGKKNFMGANGSFSSIGHGCFSLKEELEEYMDYDVGDFCKDDWKQAQRLMVHGCDPLPRRRCLARAPKLYYKPLPINESAWKLPDDRNVRWSGYRCKSFACLAANRTGKGFFKCADCFNLSHHELPRWMTDSQKTTAELDYQRAQNQTDPNTSEFLIQEVLSMKQGEMRIGLDFSVGTGTFAARMKEFNVTIVSATINLGAPFSEMIALRGFIPLYLTLNQRLPFFDNTLDMIHSTRFLDGWIDFSLLDFVLYDWDRVLRPGGLLWIDGFFCKKKDLEDYLEAFMVLRYKRRKWVVVPKLDKDGDEVFFSAVLEKPSRPF